MRGSTYCIWNFLAKSDNLGMNLVQIFLSLAEVFREQYTKLKMWLLTAHFYSCFQFWLQGRLQGPVMLPVPHTKFHQNQTMRGWGIPIWALSSRVPPSVVLNFTETRFWPSCSLWKPIFCLRVKFGAYILICSQDIPWRQNSKWRPLTGHFYCRLCFWSRRCVPGPVLHLHKLWENLALHSRVIAI